LKYPTLLLLLALSAASLAADSQNLTGSFSIGGATLIDPPADEPRNSHIYFEITGKAAERIYQMIKSEPMLDLCLDDGAMTKFADKVQCQAHPDKGEYACFFSLDVNANTIGEGVAC